MDEPTREQQRETAAAILRHLELELELARASQAATPSDHQSATWLLSRVGLLETVAQSFRACEGIRTHEEAFEAAFGVCDAVLGTIVAEPGDGSMLAVTLSEFPAAWELLMDEAEAA